MGYGIVLSSFFSEAEKGYRFGRVALSLLDRLNWREFKCLTLLWFSCFIQHRQEALRAAIPMAKEGYFAILLFRYSSFPLSFHSALT